MANKKIIFIFFLATFLIAFITKTLIDLGYFKVVLNHSPGPCKLFKVNGSEDIKILPNGLAVISSGLRYELWTSHDPDIDKRQGKLYMMDLNSPDPRLEEIMFKSFDQSGFNPHGMSVYVDPNTGRVRLFVVNHKPGGDAIEIFQFEKENHVLTHIRSVADDTIYSANSVIATGPESFYVTNDLFTRYGPNLLRMFEILIPFGGGRVVYYDGSRGKYVATGLPFPNGINMDPSGRYVYVASVAKKGVLIFRRQGNSDLVQSQFIPIGSSPDNIFVGRNADLWIGSNAVPLEFLKYIKNLSHPCPSQVINIRLGSSQSSGEVYADYELREVYSNTGHELKSSSAAAEYNGKLLIGTVYDNLLYCDIRAY